jgi:hypothetical protein
LSKLPLIKKGGEFSTYQTFQIGRFTGAGWSAAQTWTMNEIYSMLPPVGGTAPK